MQNFRKIQWIVIENFPDGRTDARTRVNSKVPIPTKVGGPKMDGSKTKSTILSHFGHFWGLFSHKRGTNEMRIIFKNPRMLHFPNIKL